MIAQINRDQLQLLLRSRDSFKLVDVLAQEHYEREHIPGAISLPEKSIDTDAHRHLDKNDMIAVYCAGFSCTASTRAAEKLLAQGYKHVLDYKGGLENYKKGDLPLAGTTHSD